MKFEGRWWWCIFRQVYL